VKNCNFVAIVRVDADCQHAQGSRAWSRSQSFLHIAAGDQN